MSSIYKFKSFGDVFEVLSENTKLHMNTTPEYEAVKEAVSEFVLSTDLTEETNKIDFWKFGELSFGYFEMGAITTLDLFGIDELILFLYYERLKQRVKTARDFGANLGLHSIIMSKLDWSVRAFEPDPVHFDKLKDNLLRNTADSQVEPLEKAVWTSCSGVEFTRVKGNTTGNHISGMKNPYGEVETFHVETVNFADELQGAGIAKLDVEGAEGELFQSLIGSDVDLDDTIIVLEVSENSRQSVFEFSKKIDMPLFCQNSGWAKASAYQDLPKSHKDGSVVLSHEAPF